MQRPNHAAALLISYGVAARENLPGVSLALVRYQDDQEPEQHAWRKMARYRRNAGEPEYFSYAI